MNCPKCGCLVSQAVVIDCRNSSNMIRRRRKCKECGNRFSTMEITYEDYETLGKELISMKSAIDDADAMMQSWQNKYARRKHESNT